MKRLICLLIFLSGFAYSQVTTPRFGTAKNTDNTGRVLTYGASTVTPTGTLVTLTSSNYWEMLTTVASTTHVPTYTIALTNANLGDHLSLMIASSTVSRVATFGTGFILNDSNSVIIPANKYAQYGFYFNGAKYMQHTKCVQP